MTRVELHDSGAGQSLPLKIHPALVAEHLRHEVLAKPRVIQPPPLLPWAVGKTIHKSWREKPASLAIQKAGSAVYLHPLQTATRRASLQNIAAEPLIHEMSGLFLRPVIHPFSVIESGTGGNQANVLAVRDEAEWFPGNAQADLEFRTHRNPLDVSAEMAS